MTAELHRALSTALIDGLIDPALNRFICAATTAAAGASEILKS